MSHIILNGITWDHSRGYDPLVAASKHYASQTGVKVVWTKRSLKDFGDQSLVKLATSFDLLINDHPHTGIAAKTACVLPLDEYLPTNVLNTLRKESAGPSYNSYHYHGHQWALPIDSAFQCASYRTDLLKSPPPKTWNGVFDLAIRLKKRGNYVGMALCPTDSLCTFLSLTAQSGSPIKEESEILIDEKNGRNVLQSMRRMRDIFHPKSLHWNPIDLYDHMTAHDDVYYTPLAFNYTNYSRKGFRKQLLKYTDAPYLCGLLGGAGIAVSASSKYAKEAVNFASWICSAEVQKEVYTLNHGQPGNIMAWQDKETNRITNDFFTSTRQTLDKAYVRPRFEKWPEFQEYLGDRIHTFLMTDSDIKLLLVDLNEAYINSKLIE